MGIYLLFSVRSRVPVPPRHFLGIVVQEIVLQRRVELPQFFVGGEHDIAPAVVVDRKDTLVFKGDKAHGGELLLPNTAADEAVDGEILSVAVGDHTVAGIGLLFFGFTVLIGTEVRDDDVAAELM